MYKSVPMYYLKTKIVTDFSDTDTLLYTVMNFINNR